MIATQIHSDVFVWDEPIIKGHQKGILRVGHLSLFLMLNKQVQLTQLRDECERQLALPDEEAPGSNDPGIVEGGA